MSDTNTAPIGWLFSYNKPPIPCEHVHIHVETRTLSKELVLPYYWYILDGVWLRRSNYSPWLGDTWYSAFYDEIPAKNKAEHLLISGGK